MRVPLLAMGAISTNSWFWSAVFHARDTKFTESADYFFATMQIMVITCASWYRMARGRLSSSVQLSLGLSVLMFYLYYVYSMTFQLFDYGWHMKINGFFVAVHYVSWLAWGLTWGKGRAYKWKSITFLTLVLAAASCEVFDFPPKWGLVDAHATWHILTAPMIPLWYSFWVDDASFETVREGKEDEGGSPLVRMGKFWNENG